ncbi:MAG: crossover junction endodeoxyribonuclease RuvC, partial [Alphaproteobacteria bacterium]|nr:crossover junction endodeoxyribonuclease RuvC [Alphaproteobacteria bacterium]
KQQVVLMVRMLLPGCLVTSLDAADALAVAICHAHHRATALRMLTARGGAPSRAGGIAS